MEYLLLLCFLADNCISESYWFQYILFSATLLNYHIVYNSFSVDSLGFSRHTITLSANNNSFTSSLLIIRPLIYFSYLTALVRLSCATLNNNCAFFWCFPIKHVARIMSNMLKYQSIHILSFYKERMLNLSNAFQPLWKRYVFLTRFINILKHFHKFSNSQIM